MQRHKYTQIDAERINQQSKQPPLLWNDHNNADRCDQHRVYADRCNRFKYMQKESISRRSSRPCCEMVTIMQIDAISTEYMQIDADSCNQHKYTQIDAERINQHSKQPPLLWNGHNNADRCISTEYMQVDADRCNRHKYMQIDAERVNQQSNQPPFLWDGHNNADRCNQHRVHAGRCR